MRSRTVSNNGMAICWLSANTVGTRLYAANTGDNTVSVYDTTDPLYPVEIQMVSLRGMGTSSALMGTGC